MIEMLSAGRKQQPAGYRNELRNYPQFMLLVVRAGELHLEGCPVGGIVRPTGMVVLTPGIAVDLSSPRTGYRGFYVEGLPAQCAVPRGVHRIVADADLRQRCGAIEDELAAPRGDGLGDILLHDLFLRVLRRLDSTPDPVALVESRLAHHRYGAHRLDELLAGLPWSRRQLERRYLAAKGLTIKQRHLNLRLAEACRLLADPTAAITGIALDLGFPSSQHFATVFRREYGCSPSRWRAQPGTLQPKG